ncbi:hypothetical protein [Geodermatophilus sp. DSM 44513]|uniref:hypothetical protein n=1 Tax=Geodermatophilus sp. DSM 44513 TaxID=1528104 RepID=UPI00126ECE7C|nr:hypothetical protein [Geodermatophilus sp. DSM 44513]WNV77486.1 hypothetical protein RTG05_09475 [Geodermatophilus sp. DSM 44513]
MRRGPALLAALGLLLVAVGGVLVAGADGVEQVVSGGRSQPPAAQAYTSTLTLAFDDAVVWTRVHLTGLALAVTGALLLAGLGGWVLGRRGP